MAFLLFAACLVIGVAYIWSVIGVYRAQLLASNSDRASIQRAVDLEPQSAEYHDVLCRGMMFAFQQVREAVAECHNASELNPYSSSVWLDLAQAGHMNGKPEVSEAAVRMAVAVDPTTPATIWSSANLLLAQNDVSEALKLFEVVLRTDPSLARQSLNVCWRSLHDVNRLKGILPPSPGEYLEFIRVLLATGDFEQADTIWSSLMGLDDAPDYKEALFYVDALLEARRVPEAIRAWNQLRERSRGLQRYYQPGDLVTDGSFTQEILNSGFDWRYNPNFHIDVALDEPFLRNKGRSLRLTYSGVGGDAGIFQYVAVRPHTEYRLSAWVKSEGIRTASGPMVAVVDAYSRQFVGSTEETAGTTPWHYVDATVTTGPAANLLMLTIVRHSEETSIRGRIWVDDISLQEVSRGPSKNVPK